MSSGTIKLGPRVTGIDRGDKRFETGSWRSCSRRWAGPRKHSTVAQRGKSSRVNRAWRAAINRIVPGGSAGCRTGVVYADDVRRQFQFHGRVQGVGFRVTARGLTSARRLTGWVRNEADGTVLMQVQGSAAAIEAMVAAVRREMARNIDRVDEVDLAEESGETGFIIAR